MTASFICGAMKPSRSVGLDEVQSGPSPGSAPHSTFMRPRL